MIPVTFLTGFYVTEVVRRYWDQFMSLPFPDELALKLVTHVPGKVGYITNEDSNNGLKYFLKDNSCIWAFLYLEYSYIWLFLYLSIFIFEHLKLQKSHAPIVHNNDSICDATTQHGFSDRTHNGFKWILRLGYKILVEIWI